jgi:hypothetical protein
MVNRREARSCPRQADNAGMGHTFQMLGGGAAKIHGRLVTAGVTGRFACGGEDSMRLHVFFLKDGICRVRSACEVRAGRLEDNK